MPASGGGANANLGLLRWMAYQTCGSASVSLSQPDECAGHVSGASDATYLTKLSTSLSDDVEACADEALATARPTAV